MSATLICHTTFIHEIAIIENLHTMKKQITILVLSLFFCISLARSQPVTGLKPADLKSISSKGLEFSFTREGNNLAVSAKVSALVCPNDSCITIELKFTGNTRQEFEAFAGAGAMAGQLKLTLVDETTGRSSEIRPADRTNEYRLVITFPKSHVYKFMLNGKVIGAGYKPNK